MEFAGGLLCVGSANWKMDKVGFGQSSGSLRTNINASEYKVVKVEQRGKEGFNSHLNPLLTATCTF